MKKCATTIHFIIACITILFCIENSKNKENRFFDIGYFVFLFFALFLTAMSGRQYDHYYMTMIPPLVYPISRFFKTVFKENAFKLTIHGQTYSAQLCCFAAAFFIIGGWISLCNNSDAMILSKWQNRYLDDIVSLIERNTSTDERIIVFGNSDIFYLKSQRLAASRYSYQLPIATIDSKIMDEFFSEIEIALPKVAVVDYRFNPSEHRFFYKKIDCFFQENKYENSGETGKEYSIFMRACSK